ncbi:MAG: hypothetical protein AAF078_07565 [Planctomycetota bacterium]
MSSNTGITDPAHSGENLKASGAKFRSTCRMSPPVEFNDSWNRRPSTRRDKLWQHIVWSVTHPHLRGAMMARQLKLEIANLVVKFGDENLLDRADDLVLPAFFHDFERKYGRTKYIFHKVDTAKVEWDDGDDIAVYGRLVKDTVLEREQVLQDGEIVADYSEMESAPSAIFVLLVRHHRLLYVKEQGYAPTPQQYKNRTRCGLHL